MSISEDASPKREPIRINGNIVNVPTDVTNSVPLLPRLPNTPYSKMAANKLFFCLHVN